MEIPDTRYAVTRDGVYLAYRRLGQGTIDMLVQFDWMGNVDTVIDVEPSTRALWREVASYARVIFYDRRGTGLSSRNVSPPNLETAVADTQVVLDAIGSQRPVLFGFLAGGGTNAMLAATNPERVRSIIWLNPVARSVWTQSYPWGVRPEYVEHSERAIMEGWGTAEHGRVHNLAEAMAGATAGHLQDPEDLVGYLSRHTATPDVALEMARNWYETDVRGVLPAVGVPTLLVSHGPDHEQAEHVASLMPNATLMTIDSPHDRPAANGMGTLAEMFREWIGLPKAAVGIDTVLSTALFTDIVGSAEKQAALGDASWKALVHKHHAIVRESLRRWRGAEIDTAGDGFYATFDGPARAIRCALEVTAQVRDLGIEIRAGTHTGECELIDGKIGGLSVTIGARVAGHAGPSEVLVSQTVKDLVAGSGLAFEDRGEHELKGVPGRWRLYAVLNETG
jgi:class 3 adenylate cyclase